MAEPPSKDWSSRIMELEKCKSRWNLSSDLKLLEVLKSTSGELVEQIYSKLSNFDDLSFQTNVTANKLNNLITSMLIMTNTKFIENRVYEEDIKEITSSTVKSTEVNHHNHHNSASTYEEQEVIERLKKSIDTAVGGLCHRYQLQTEDFGGEANKYTLLHTLYTVRNGYLHQPLPHLIGSNEFLRDTFVGLKVDDYESDNRVIVLNPSGTQSTVAITNEDDDDDDEGGAGAEVTTNNNLHNSSDSLFAFDRNMANRSSSVKPSIRENSMATGRTSNLFADGADGENSEDEEDDFFNEAKVKAKRSFNLPQNEEEEDFEQSPGPVANSNMVNNVMNTRLDSQFFDDQDDSDDDLFVSKLPSTSSKSEAIVKNQGDSGSAGTIDSKSSSSKEISTPKLTNVARHFDSIFDSDTEDVDIFNTRLPSKVKAPEPSASIAKTIASKPKKSHLFSSSSEDDDDDLFSRISSRVNVKKKDATLPATTAAKTTTTTVTGEMVKKPLNAVPHMFSMISELSSVIKKKSNALPSSSSSESLDRDTTEVPNPVVAQISSPSSNGDAPFGQTESAEKSSQPATSTVTVDPIPTDTPSMAILPDLSSSTEPDINEFNSILKHKAKLSAARQRRPPTKMKYFVDSDNNLFNSNTIGQSDAVKLHDASADDDDDDNDKAKESVPEKAPVEVPSETSKSSDIVTPSPVSRAPPVKSTRNVFSSSDDSDTDLFLPRPAPKQRSAATNNHPSQVDVKLMAPSENRPIVDSTPEAKSTVVKSVSLFSDDSDDDIFKKPALSGTLNKPKGTKEPPKVSLFFDSDEEDGDDTFLTRKSTISSTVPSIRAPTTSASPQTTNAKPSAKVPPVKKSLFDDDDSDDDLFKF